MHSSSVNGESDLAFSFTTTSFNRSLSEKKKFVHIIHTAKKIVSGDFFCLDWWVYYNCSKCFSFSQLLQVAWFSCDVRAMFGKMLTKKGCQMFNKEWTTKYIFTFSNTVNGCISLTRNIEDLKKNNSHHFSTKHANYTNNHSTQEWTASTKQQSTVSLRINTPVCIRWTVPDLLPDKWQ